MKFLLFGQIGSGKSFVGELLEREFAIPYYDGDKDLPPSIITAIKNHQPIDESMRDEFAGAIIDRMLKLSARHPHFCVAQALFKNRHRTRIQTAIPDLTLVWIQSPELIMRSRLQERTDHIATTYYAEQINPGFESPSMPHRVIENSGDSAILRSQLAALLSAMGAIHD